MAGWDPDVDAGHDIEEITPHDTNTIGPYRGIAFAGAGILRITTQAGSDVTIPSGVLAAGMIHPLRFTLVHTDTTATDIWGVL